MYPPKSIDLDLVDISALADAGRMEGFRHVDRLVSGWRSSSNRFDKPGELRLGAFDGGHIVSVGGLNRDPYLHDDLVGRIRHPYVLPAFRRRGVAKTLVGALISHARESFQRVRVRAAKGDTPRFYRAIGFEQDEAAEATHAFRLI